MNDELVSSAVSFLRDASVALSPLAKKVEFLESKGLNQQEIEEALKRANAQPQPLPPPQQPPQQPALEYYPPPVPERTWKDYFIMATATAGVAYGVYQVVSKYIIPTIVPPSQLRVDDDKAKIDEEFAKIDKVLEQMALEQSGMRLANEAKLGEIDAVIDNVNDFLARYNKDKLKFDDDLRLMKLEIDSIKNQLDRNMSLTKENIGDELTEISQELALLRNLIKARDSSAQALARKVVPVSLIPSVLDILKKPKENKVKSEEKPEQKLEQKPEQKPELKPESKPKENTLSSAPTPPAAFGDVFAAGIPDWQLKHKQQEESKEKEGEDMQFWKQAMQNGNDMVEKSIENVGVPAWQLSAK